MAWLKTISRGHAEGALAQVYAAMAARKIPDVYVPPHGDAPGIIRAHSLDATLMQAAFATTGALHATSMAWVDRELIATATSRTNQCFY
jgi:alkylhydroperoxidase family enzyme